MPHLNNSRRSSAPAALFLALIPLALVACGGSSKQSAPRVKTTAGVPRGVQAHTASFRKCLQEHGVNLPKRAPGSSGESRLPKGVTRTQLLAALDKCAGHTRLPEIGGQSSSSSIASADRSILQFVTCMRAHGIKLPTPNISGTGPALSSKGVDTTSSAYKTAQARCAGELAAGAAAGG